MTDDLKAKVHAELTIRTLNDMADGNAQLMGEIYNDPHLTAAERLKHFSMGIRNQVMLSRDAAARRKELMGAGMKPNGAFKQLLFNPAGEPEEQETTPAKNDDEKKS